MGNNWKSGSVRKVNEDVTMRHGGCNVLMRILYTSFIRVNKDVTSISRIDLTNHWPQYQLRPCSYLSFDLIET